MTGGYPHIFIFDRGRSDRAVDFSLTHFGGRPGAEIAGICSEIAGDAENTADMEEDARLYPDILSADQRWPGLRREMGPDAL